MKKLMILSAATLMFAACVDDSLVDKSSSLTGKEGPISFVKAQKNMTRSTSALQTAGHYNFGVFAYKSTDKVNNIMADYLVGFHDDANGYSASGTTVGDDVPGRVDGVSQWMYEGLGYNEFTGTYAGQRLNAGEAFASNVANQYLRYWDKGAENTYFYAYAPYVNTTATGKTVTYVDGQEVGTSSDKYVMTIPFGTIEHATVEDGEDYSLYEFMYASTKVAKANYGHDVALNFQRLNAKVNIKFWEDIPGYNVRIIDVTDDYSVSAVPAINDGTSGKYGYKLGAIYTKNGAKIQFADGVATGVKQYEGETTDEPINFKAPTAAQIGETRLQATPSTTTYFAIPKGSSAGVLSNTAIQTSDAGTLNTDLDDTGLTFHVSYELISNTGEVITVKDATVFVPTTYTNWAANTHYTYIFKITTNSNGTTDSDDTPNPTDPEVPTEKGLYPIVFDNCTVEAWEEIESEHIITENTGLAYHDVQLNTYSIATGVETPVTVTVTDNDTYKGHTIDYSAITVKHSSGTNVTSWYNTSSHIITVPADATAGVYTVTYTCTPGTLQYDNHPATWTETFVVGHTYGVKTNLTEVGTNGLAASKLVISTKMDGAAFTEATATTGLSIEYPVNAVDDKVTVALDGGKACVTVANDATPGEYKLVYTVTVEGEPVKVAEQVFNVVDYQFALNYKTVYNKDGGNTVTATTRTAGTGVTYTYTVTGGFTVTGANIAVPNNSIEGDYTVTLTVNKGGDSEVQYQATFTVQNAYTVALSKNTLNTTVGAPNGAVYGTDFIDITSKSNGVADALSAATAAKYTVNGLTKGTDYKIDFVAAVAAEMYTDAAEYNAANGTSLDDSEFAALSTSEKTKTPAAPAHIKLQVKTSVAAGKYTVVYTGQTTPDTKTATADFVIQK